MLWYGKKNILNGLAKHSNKVIQKSFSEYESTPITYLKGVGPQRAELLGKELQIFTIGDLLQLAPNRYIDKSKVHQISELHPEIGNVQVLGKIISIELIGNGRSKRLKAVFCFNNSCMELLWFQSIPWARKTIEVGQSYLAFGRVSEFKGTYSMSHPEISPYDPNNTSSEKKLSPVYPLTEKLKSFKIDSKTIAQWIENAFQQNAFSLPEFIPEEIVGKLKLLPREEAVKKLHQPSNYQESEQALTRLKFEEIFLFQLRGERTRLERIKNSQGPKISKPGYFFNEFYHNHLPFELTEAQKKVLKEIWADMKSGYQMNRLLQGDVGSGKTIVAFICTLLAIDNGYQGCLMAPTEILAQQHYESLKEWGTAIGLKTALLTGSTSKKERDKMLQELAEGELKIIIGTHAVLENRVQFKQLGIVIIDEQHRFGVAQRSKLWLKSNPSPHMLVMTATPIPRTLAMTAHGESDHSIIDQLPKGRKPIATIHKEDYYRMEIMHFIKTEIQKGRQIYFVFPLIEESASLDLKNLMDGYDMVTGYFPTPEYKISILHGKMKADEKEAEMNRFKEGRAHIMVATTVIEVGVNVPNASVMVIESAERFGLSQLHQLRGRVGRGAEQSYCILMTKERLSQTAKERMQAMVRHTDGFEIAKIDLKQRGPGDILGTKQSGLPSFKFIDLVKDEQWITLARYAAKHLMKNDPKLELPENNNLKKYLLAHNSDNFWSKIS